LGPLEVLIPAETQYSSWMDTPTHEPCSSQAPIPEFGFGYGSHYGSMDDDGLSSAGLGSGQLPERSGYIESSSDDDKSNSIHVSTENEVPPGNTVPPGKVSSNTMTIRILGPMESFVPPEAKYSKWMDTPKHCRGASERKFPEFGFGYGSMMENGSFAGEDQLYASRDQSSEKDDQKKFERPRSQDKVPSWPQNETPAGRKKAEERARSQSTERARSQSTERVDGIKFEEKAMVQERSDKEIDSEKYPQLPREKKSNFQVKFKKRRRSTSSKGGKSNFRPGWTIKRRGGSEEKENTGNNANRRNKRKRGNKRKRDQYSDKYANKAHKFNVPKYKIRILTPIMHIKISRPDPLQFGKRRWPNRRRQVNLQPRITTPLPETPLTAPETPFDPLKPYNSSIFLMRTDVHPPLGSGDDGSVDEGDDNFGYGSMDFETPCEDMFGDFMDSPSPPQSPFEDSSEYESPFSQPATDNPNIIPNLYLPATDTDDTIPSSDLGNSLSIETGATNIIVYPDTSAVPDITPPSIITPSTTGPNTTVHSIIPTPISRNDTATTNTLSNRLADANKG